jgi:mannosylglycerate hydrolase MGH1-like protein
MGTNDVLEQAHRLLAENTRTATFEGRTLTFSVPSGGRYPFQWFWDSCFHAVVWARIDPERAGDELRALFALQAGDGFIPHVIFWDQRLVSRHSWHHLESRGRADWFLPGRTPRTTAMIQPPVIAQAVEAVVEAGASGFLEEVLPALERYYRFLARARDPDRDGLISIIAQFESGLDFSPAYDPPAGSAVPSPWTLALRGRLPEILNKALGYDLDRIFRLNRSQREDVLVNSVYADGLGALARLAARTSAVELREWAETQAALVRERLLERCYDEQRGLFFNLEGRDERPGSRVKTVISLLPLLLADLPPEVVARLLEHLTDPREFWAPFPVPSVALDEPTFSPDSLVNGRRRIWRGPNSMSTNWLLSLGLRRHGQSDLADELAQRSRDLVERGGFNEFFNPLDGTPVGEPRFGWATLAAVL